MSNRLTSQEEQERGEINPSDVDLKKKQNPFRGDDLCVSVGWLILLIFFFPTEGGSPASIPICYSSTHLTDSRGQSRPYFKLVSRLRSRPHVAAPS